MTDVHRAVNLASSHLKALTLLTRVSPQQFQTKKHISVYLHPAEFLNISALLYPTRNISEEREETLENEWTCLWCLWVGGVKSPYASPEEETCVSSGGIPHKCQERRYSPRRQEQILYLRSPPNPSSSASQTSQISQDDAQNHFLNNKYSTQTAVRWTSQTFNGRHK